MQSTVREFTDEKSMNKFATLMSAAALAVGLLGIAPSAHAANADA